MDNIRWKTAALSYEDKSLEIKPYSLKKTILIALVILLLLIAGILVSKLIWGLEKNKELYIDYTTNAYREYSEFARQPSNFSKEILKQYEPFHPSAMLIMTQYSEEGLEPSLLTLYDRLAHSDDPKETLELHASLLTIGSMPGCRLLNDPQFVIELFQGKYDSAITEDEKAAAEYLIALTYTIGYFSKAVLTDEEYADLEWASGEKRATEVEKLYNSRCDVIKEKGLADLRAFIQKYPASKTAFIARIDYTGMKYFHDERTPDIGIHEEGLRVALEYYPDSAFVTSSYFGLGAVNRIKREYRKAAECFSKALEYPDYMTSGGDSAHDAAEEEIKICTRDHATPPPSQ